MNTKTLTSEESNINEKQLFQKIIYTIQDYLKSKFDEPIKQQINTYDNRANFSCPICGDSTKMLHKKRGNIYLSFSYKCYNCGYFSSLYNFLKKIGKINNFSAEEAGYIYRSFKVNPSDNIGHAIYTGYLFEEIEKYAININYLKEKYNLVNASKNKRSSNYLKKRSIPLESLGNRLLYDSKQDALVFVNTTKDDKSFIGMQYRYLKSKGFNTYSYNKCLLDLGYEVSQDNQIVETVDNFSNLFNIMHVNFNFPIYLFEGPIDCLLFDNAIASCGSSNFSNLQFKNLYVFQDNDAEGKRLAQTKVKKGTPVFMWSKFLKDYKLETHNIKDLNDIVIKNPEIDINNLKKYFTESKYDYIYV